MQPYIAFVGEDVQSISSYYVRVNQRCWCFEDLLIALEDCTALKNFLCSTVTIQKSVTIHS